MSKKNSKTQKTVLAHVRYENHHPDALILEVPQLGGDTLQFEFPMSALANKNAVKRELLAHGVPNKHVNEVTDIVLNEAPETQIVISRAVGWNDSFDRFVLPSRTLLADGIYVAAGDALEAYKRIDQEEPSNDIRSWRRSLSPPATRSRYIVLAIAAGFAAPLMKFANISESVVFNFVGRSGCGKTLTSRVAASVSGASTRADFASWQDSPRAIAEAAQLYNDRVLVIDDFMRGESSPRRRFDRLNEIGRMLPDGRSRAVTKTLAESGLDTLTWRSICFTSSEFPSARIALDANRHREDGHRARFIDIPVPGRTAGGIFDKVQADDDPIELAAQLERALDTEDTLPLYSWVAWLEEHQHDLSDRIEKGIRRYLVKSKGLVGLEHRIATKFALLAVAARLACEAGLTPWQDAKKAVIAIRKLMDAALAYDPGRDRLFHDVAPAILQEIASVKSDGGSSEGEITVLVEHCPAGGRVFLKPEDELPIEYRSFLMLAEQEGARVFGTQGRKNLQNRSSKIGPQKRLPCIDLDWLEEGVASNDNRRVSLPTKAIKSKVMNQRKVMRRKRKRQW